METLIKHKFEHTNQEEISNLSRSQNPTLWQFSTKGNFRFLRRHIHKLRTWDVGEYTLNHQIYSFNKYIWSAFHV